MSETRDLTPNDPRSPEELAQGHRGPVVDDSEVRPDLGAEGLRYGEPAAEEVGPPPLTEPDVRRWLDRLGRVAAWIVGRFTATPEDLEPPAWRFTEEELSELAPPATRVINRRLLWMAGVIRNADEIELGFLLLEYVDGNLERVRAAREAAEATEEPLDDEGEPVHRGPDGFGLDIEEGADRLKGRP